MCLAVPAFLPPQTRQCTCGAQLTLPHLLLDCQLHPNPLLPLLRSACTSPASLPHVLARLTAGQCAMMTGRTRTQLATSQYQLATRPMISYYHSYPPPLRPRILIRFDASLQGTPAGIGVAVWRDGQMEWGAGYPVCAGKSVPLLEMLAAFVALFSARFSYPGQPVQLIGDN